MIPIMPLQMLAGTHHFDKTHPGWTLFGPASEGVDREFKVRIDFECEFSLPPVVQVALAGFDADTVDTLRLRVQARHIDKTGFTILISTWFDSQIHGVDVSWLALGS